MNHCFGAPPPSAVVVLLTSAFFGLYLWGLDLLIGRAIEWVYRSFGAA